MNKFIVIAYSTKNDYYEELSINLRRSCESNNIPIYLELIDSKGSWETNTHYKAEFIKKCLSELDYNNFVYVDVDAIFLSYPTLFDNIDCDISFRLENFKWRKNEPLSGTIYLKKSAPVMDFLNDWIRINSEIPAKRFDPFTWEQYNMKRALDLHTELVFNNLPAQYVYITDHSKRLYPEIVAVIEHFQASRQINRKK